MKTIWTDRSRTETYQHCPRERWLRYHEAGMGLEPPKKPLPLCVGGAVHKGLESLLRQTMDGIGIIDESVAVAAALADFSTHRSALALDTTEQAAMSAVIDPRDAGFDAQVLATARDLGMDANDPAMTELLGRQRNAAAEYDEWLYAEQSALVEAMVRAYARRRLRPLLEEFEVLEVEREGDWELASWLHDDQEEIMQPWQLRFMSRPDALLRSRSDNSLYLLSYKTAATWDIRKARDAEHDMQGLSEGVEVERRLGQWWTVLHGTDKHNPDLAEIPIATQKYLAALPASPRILGIRYEYLLKGGRWEDKDLSARFGIRVWSQRSHLIRKYVATSTPSRGQSSYTVGDECWSNDYLKDDGSSTSKLAWQNWRARPVWEDGPDAIRRWIDALDDSQMAMSAYDSTTGAEPRELGWKSRAQSLGYTTTHPLDAVFPAPLTVYRQDDQLRDFVEQVESIETKVAESVVACEQAQDEGEKRHLLNIHFPMSRRACSYPSECAFVPICYGGSDIQKSPLESSKYKIRVPNHIQEKEASEMVSDKRV